MQRRIFMSSPELFISRARALKGIAWRGEGGRTVAEEAAKRRGGDAASQFMEDEEEGVGETRRRSRQGRG